MENCLTCSGNQTGKCTSCRPNYYLASTGLCLPTLIDISAPNKCPGNREYKNKTNNKCESCHSNCNLIKRLFNITFHF